MHRATEFSNVPARSTTLTVMLLLAAPGLLTDPWPNAGSSVQAHDAREPKSRVPRGDPNKLRRPVRGVDPSRLADCLRSAEQIDRLVESACRRHRIELNEAASDSRFVRRVSLNIAGTIPSLPLMEWYFTSAKPATRRLELIDRLLNSEAYVSNQFNYWGNILRLIDRPRGLHDTIYQFYHLWIKRALRDNISYDRFVYEQLTAQGLLIDNGAAGYWLRDPNMPLDQINNTVRIFLGTQIGCAQCHDHPFDRWTRHEFYQMAAFTYGIQQRYSAGDKKRFGTNPIRRLTQELKSLEGQDARFQGWQRNLVDMNLYAVTDNPGRRLHLPQDYQYDNAKPGASIEPTSVFGPPASIGPEEAPRVAFARWLTSPENPRFAKAIANRLWKHVMGVGLIEPVDDIRDDSKPSNSKLLEFLTQEMVRLNFNMKEFFRILYNTRTFQRESHAEDIDLTEPYYFQGPVLRRMTAEQIWDSLMMLAVYDVDTFERTNYGGFADVVRMDLRTINLAQVRERAKQYEESFSRRAQNADDRGHSYKGWTLARASELPLPVPRHHFLRQFGQGDRQSISGATGIGSVAQILAMFNGEVTHMMLEEGSVIYDNVLKAPTLNDQVNVIFLSILNRFPTGDEREICRKEIRVNGAAGYGNVIWSLVNTKEFLFVQ